MPLFNRRERIAVTVICVLILTGWAVRLTVGGPERGITVIRDAVPVPGGSAVSPETRPVDINTASAAELASLPMIGPVKAAAVMAYREEHGHFAVPADIMKVTGIGPATFDAVRDMISTGADSLSPVR